MKLNKITLALLALGIGLGGNAGAATDAERIAQLEAQMKALMEQLAALKASTASANQEVADLKDQVSAQGKEAVVAGDIPGSFRVPGTETSVRLYGVGELNMVHEMKGDGGKNDYATFMPYMPLRGSADAKRSGETYLHARTSRIGIEAATPTEYGMLTAKVEGDFNNDPRTGNSAVYGSLANIYTQQATNSYEFRLRHAYFQLGSWLVGQTWSTFMDTAALPEAVDFIGPTDGVVFVRQPQIRYTTGNFQISLEDPQTTIIPRGGGAAASSDRGAMPDVAARYTWKGSWGHFGVAALLRDLAVDRQAAGTGSGDDLLRGGERFA